MMETEVISEYRALILLDREQEMDQSALTCGFSFYRVAHPFVLQHRETGDD